jgi:hypothetical protein
LLEEIRKVSLQTLKGVKCIEISIDWTSIEHCGRLGLSSSEKGHSWNYATKTKYRGKILLLAFVPQVIGMTKEEIVKALVWQLESMGFNINLITLDAGFDENTPLRVEGSQVYHEDRMRKKTVCQGY